MILSNKFNIIATQQSNSQNRSSKLCCLFQYKSTEVNDNLYFVVFGMLIIIFFYRYCLELVISDILYFLIFYIFHTLQNFLSIFVLIHRW